MLGTIFLYAAVLGGLLLVVQLAMTLLGMDDGAADAGGVDVGGFDGGLDGGPDGGGDASTDTGSYWFFEMLSLRTLSAAACFFGLVGKMFLAAGQPPVIAGAAAVAAGYAAMYSVYWVFRQVFRMETWGNEDLAQSVGLPAEVYVPVSPAGGPPGKVHLSLQGRTVECQAVTDHAERLPTGARVVVVDVVAEDTVKVEPARPAA